MSGSLSSDTGTAGISSIHTAAAETVTASLPLPTDPIRTLQRSVLYIFNQASQKFGRKVRIDFGYLPQGYYPKRRHSVVRVRQEYDNSGEHAAHFLIREKTLANAASILELADTSKVPIAKHHSGKPSAWGSDARDLLARTYSAVAHGNLGEIEEVFSKVMNGPVIDQPWNATGLMLLYALRI